MKIDLQINEELELCDYSSLQITNWKSTYRDIKINYLLGTPIVKLEFEFNKSNFIIMNDDYEKNTNFIIMNDVCCVATKIMFILKGEKIEKVTLEIEVLKTPKGEIVKSLLDDGFYLSIKQVLIFNYLHFIIYPIKI